jgi:hypothetical protein
MSQRVSEREVDRAPICKLVECLGLIEAAHFDRPFDGLSSPAQRQLSVGLSRDSRDAPIKVRRKGTIRFEFSFASCPALSQRGIIKEREAYRSLDLESTRPSEKYSGGVRIDALPQNAIVRRRLA